MQVFNSYNGTGNKTLTLSSEAVSACVINTGSASLTMTINNVAIIVPAGEKFNDVFEPFKTVAFVASDTYSVIFRK